MVLRNYIFVFLLFFVIGCTQLPQSQMDEAEIKIYLIEKYTPGSCFGMPSVVPNNEISKTIRENRQLANFAKERFGLYDDIEIYEKVRQLNGIMLQKTGDGYSFKFQDGKCCTINSYEGTVKIEDGSIIDEITRQTEENVPC